MMAPELRWLHLPATPGDERLNSAVVIVATTLAVPFALGLSAIAIATRRLELLGSAVTPSVTAMVGLWMLIRRRPVAIYHLLISGACLVLYTALGNSGIAANYTVGLVAMGMTGILFVRRRVSWYIAGVAITIALTTLWWHDGATSRTEDRLIAATSPTLLFVFAAWLLWWFRRELELGQLRFRSLLERAPVALWHFDFTPIGQWFDALRRAGVRDLEAHLASHPHLVAEATRRIRLVQANQIASDLIDFSRLAGVIQLLRSKTAQSLRTTVTRVLGALWNDELTTEIEAQFVTRDGSRHIVMLRMATPMRDGRLQLDHVMLTGTDITEVRAGEEALQRLMRSKDEFVASVSHELRTPLTAVVGFAEELRDGQEGFEPEEIAAFIDMIAENGREMAHIVDDLLVAARFDEGALDLHWELLDPLIEVRSVMVTQGRHASLVAPAQPPPRILADGVRLRQIIRNLLVNAHRHGSGEVTVGVDAEGDDVLIEVRDQGTAIPESERERIFEPYYRSQRAPGVTASVGLGLTISRQLARMMGGELRYRHDGAESIFELSLPTVTQEPGAVPETALGETLTTA